MARQAITLNRVEEELPPTFDLAKVGDIELQKYTENASKKQQETRKMQQETRKMQQETRKISLSNWRGKKHCPCTNYNSTRPG